MRVPSHTPRQTLPSAGGMPLLSINERNLGFYLPSVDPHFDAIRSHPRFRAVLQRANLPAHAENVRPASAQPSGRPARR
jgi:hypothetical protein